MREIMALADRANQYIDTHKPWTLARQADKGAEVQAVCTQGLNLFRVLMIYLQPVLPRMAGRAQRFLQESEWSWESASKPLLGTAILPYEPLATRLDSKAVSALIAPEVDPGAAEPKGAVSAATASVSAPSASALAAGASAPATAASAPAAKPATAGAAAPATPPAPISIEDFMRVDLRVAKILEADLITGADKLLKLRLDVGELGERQIFAGIRAAYDPKALVGRLIVVVANLQPRKMRFGTSEGMMLAAGPGGTDIFVLSPDSGAQPGMRVK
jgi:methionyl-tRNA synthetase